MIQINFNKADALGPGYRLDNAHGWTSTTTPDARHWSQILYNLREECPLEIQHGGFYGWLEKEWNCKAIFADDNYTSYLKGIEIDEASYTMLLMRFPK